MANRIPPVHKPRKHQNVSSAAISDGEEEVSDEQTQESPPIPKRRQNKDSLNHNSPPTSPVQRNSRFTNPNEKANKAVEGPPETTIGEAVKMKGHMVFDRLLRIEGEFEGTLESKGSLIVGPKGVLRGPLTGIKEVLVDSGKVYGNISVDKVVLKGKAQIFGDITAKSLQVEPHCVIVGKLNVNPHAPETMTENGSTPQGLPSKVVSETASPVQPLPHIQTHTQPQTQAQPVDPLKTQEVESENTPVDTE